MCSQCGDRFHTSILLAGHKRIHNTEDDIYDEDDDYKTQDMVLGNTSKAPSFTALLNYCTSLNESILHDRDQDKVRTFTENSVLEESNLGQNVKDEIEETSVWEESNLDQNVKICKDETEETSVWEESNADLNLEIYKDDTKEWSDCEGSNFDQNVQIRKDDAKEISVSEKRKLVHVDHDYALPPSSNLEVSSMGTAVLSLNG